MKFLIVMVGLPFLMAFPHPFAQQGSIDTDSTLMKERTERAEQNQRQHQEALEFIEEQKQEQKWEKEKESKRDMNEAEKLVD